ncbi:MAG: glycosyltransferase family 39 protein, partial [Elusimicrobiota bacterium]
MPSAKKRIILGFLILAGFGIRIWNVEIHDWHYDEMLHVVAAQSLLETGSRTMPSGWVYSRSPVVTAGGALMFRFFGASKTAGRLPAVLIGTLLIFLLYQLTKDLIGYGPALGVSFLYAFSPYCITASRFFRYYADVQLFSLLAFFLVLPYLARSYETGKVFPLMREALRREPLRCMGGCLSLAVSLYLMKSDNKLSLSIFVGVIVVLGIRFLIEVFRQGFRKAVRRSDCAILGLLLFALILTYIVSPLSIKKIYWESQRIDRWAYANADNLFYYVQLFLRDYPSSLIVVPLGSSMICRKEKWKGAM